MFIINLRVVCGYDEIIQLFLGFKLNFVLDGGDRFANGAHIRKSGVWIASESFGLQWV